MKLENGKVLSNQLAMALNANLTKDDKIKIAEASGLSLNMVQSLLSRARSITINNKPLVIELLRVAIENANTYRESLMSYDYDYHF